jgi:hypothetical protein
MTARRGCFAPEHVGVRGVGQAAVNGHLQPTSGPVESFGGPLSCQEGMVALINITGALTTLDG